MPIARYPSFILDCPDATALATFYGAEAAVVSAQRLPRRFPLRALGNR